MSILVNLLPDVRQAKLRERRRRQLVGGVSVLVWIVCGGVVALMTIYELGQKAVIAGYTKSIGDNTAKLQAEPNIIEALTAQQHLASLPGLYAKRVYATKFFAAYIQANPAEVSLGAMTVDAQNLMVINGTGKSYAAVAKLARALEADNVKVGTNAAETNAPYFQNVTITSVASATGGVSFSISTTLSSEVNSGN